MSSTVINTDVNNSIPQLLKMVFLSATRITNSALPVETEARMCTFASRSAAY